MATASRTLSPGGALLRTSRMFSLPQAIPAPPGDYQAATNYNSETATQPYPTLQTVTVPENFRQRGDWGFKRNFPMRSTARTSTPYLRVKQVDSIEHVTDFASAADHTLSLQKWQEMNVTISLPHFISETPTSSIFAMGMKPESAFEDKYDFTAVNSVKKSMAGQMRWKYEGPWLATLTEGEFKRYIKKSVRPRRIEFNRFLREKLASELSKAARVRAAKEGGDEAVKGVMDMQPDEITDAQLTNFLRDLRHHRHNLYEIVGEFLDLPPIEPPGNVAKILDELSPNQSRTVERENPYAVHGPPITHPSAGLSYLRTSAYIDNHPVYGPLRHHPPVKGRIFVSNNDVTSFGKSGTLGLGGFIVGSKQMTSDFIRGGRTYDLSIQGGQKTWAHVFSAQVNSQGRVLLHAEEAVEKSAIESKIVQEEMLGEKRAFHNTPKDSQLDILQPPKEPKTTSKLDRKSPYINGNTKFTPGSSERYGLPPPPRWERRYRS